MRRSSTRVLALCVAVLLLGGGYAFAQFRGGFRGFEMLGGGSGLAPAVPPDAKLAICRLVYPEGRRYAGGWRTDYPLGERNLSIRFSELTRTPVSKAPNGQPNHYLVRLTDESLFQCPILMAGDPASMELTPELAATLRTYLLKGGFLWTDDHWGTEQWSVWTLEVSKMFDPSEFPIVDVPISDPVFHAQFEVTQMPQIPNIQHWRSARNSSEMGADSAVPNFKAVRDRSGRIMIAMTHNTDIADAFEREGDDPDFFYRFAPNGYALGVNILLHALTH